MIEKKLYHLIDGEKREQNSGNVGVILNPALEEVLHDVPYADAPLIDEAVKAAEVAFQSWSVTPPSARAKRLNAWHAEIEKNQNTLAELISKQHGKSLIEAKGSIARGLDVLSHACSAPELLKGSYSQNVANGVDVFDIRQPLGVCAGITPYNFPIMIPLWMTSLALAAGNTFILKPSERNSACGLYLAELALKAGLPKGVLNVVHGAKEAVNGLLHHPKIAAISFVGQTPTARYVQQTAIANGKRVQAFGGAKNHMVIMEDADITQTAEALVGAAFGSAGQRCMAISVAVVVGNKIKAPLIEKIKALTEGLDLEKDIGPLITGEQKKRVLAYIENGLKEGAKLTVDGRKKAVPSKGYYLNPCLFEDVLPTMRIYQEEIFGPVLCVVSAQTYEEALALVGSHPFANGVAIFTRDGDAARDFSARVQVGMVGINVPIPVPAGFHSFGGWKDSSFADIGMHGLEGLHFFTKLKTTTTRWPSGIKEGIDFSLPTHA